MLLYAKFLLSKQSSLVSGALCRRSPSDLLSPEAGLHARGQGRDAPGQRRHRHLPRAGNAFQRLRRWRWRRRRQPTILHNG